jgi:hypothetical protein
LLPAGFWSDERLIIGSWEIRNCGLMLFRALMARMRRRTTGAKISMGHSATSNDEMKISFQKYPGLVPLVSRLLATTIPKPMDDPSFETKMSWNLSISTERVFPALELIGSKLSSSSAHDESTLRGLVLAHTKNPVWGIRDHSARVFAALVDLSEILPTVREICNSASLSLSENHIHGSVLCVRYLLERLWAAPIGYWRGTYRV